MIHSVKTIITLFLWDSNGRNSISTRLEAIRFPENIRLFLKCSTIGFFNSSSKTLEITGNMDTWR